MWHTLHLSSNATKWTPESKIASAESVQCIIYKWVHAFYLPNKQSICLSQFALIILHLSQSLLHNGEKRIYKNTRYHDGFDDFMVILIIALVLATITLLFFFFDGIIRRTHPIANKKEYSKYTSSSNPDNFSEVINNFCIF